MNWETKYKSLKAMIEDDSRRYAEQRRQVELLLTIRDAVNVFMDHDCQRTGYVELIAALEAYDEAMKG